MKPLHLSADASAGAVYRSPVVPSNPDTPAPAAPRLLDRERHEIHLRHYPIRTEDAYADWVRRYVVFHGKRHRANSVHLKWRPS